MSQGVNQQWSSEHFEPVKSKKMAVPPRPLTTWELFFMMLLAVVVGGPVSWLITGFGIVVFRAVFL